LSQSCPKNGDAPKFPFPYSGSGGAIGWHNILQNRRSDAISIRILQVRTLLAARVPLILRVKAMKVPPILEGDSFKRLLQGAAAGAVVAMIVGFNWGGWTLGSTVEKVSKERADTAVVAALAPICVDQFRQAANATALLHRSASTNSARRRTQPQVSPS
jgi:hypothetical protein